MQETWNSEIALLFQRYVSEVSRNIIIFGVVYKARENCREYLSVHWYSIWHAPWISGGDQYNKWVPLKLAGKDTALSPRSVAWPSLGSWPRSSILEVLFWYKTEAYIQMKNGTQVNSRSCFIKKMLVFDTLVYLSPYLLLFL